MICELCHCDFVVGRVLGKKEVDRRAVCSQCWNKANGLWPDRGQRAHYIAPGQTAVINGKIVKG